VSYSFKVSSAPTTFDTILNTSRVGSYAYILLGIFVLLVGSILLFLFKRETTMSPLT